MRVFGIVLACIFLLFCALAMMGVIASVIAADEYDEAMEKYCEEREREKKHVQDN